MIITLPATCMVLLVGPSGSGKSTFGRTHFLPTEVVSSDHCRGLVSDDENNQASTPDAFAVLKFLLKTRLSRSRLTVVDATNVKPEDRAELLAIAKEHHVLSVAIVFDLPERTCHARNELRPDRTMAARVVRQQSSQLHRWLRTMKREGFSQVLVLKSPEEVSGVEVKRVPLRNDRREMTGPFDLIGDIHGCHDELVQLLSKLGYQCDEGRGFFHADGRKVIFLGDLVDRGPNSPDVLRTVMQMCATGNALCVAGNHEVKLLRHLRGETVKHSHGLAQTVAQFANESPEFAASVREFVDSLVSHYVLDGGKLVVAHAGLREELHGRASKAVREFALYGESTGETDEYGLPVRYDWALEYRGHARVVYGHTPVVEANWVNHTLCIDTGCVFGGKLTALQYPENELVEVPAAKVYYEPVRPLNAGASAASASIKAAARAAPDALAITDVTGKRHVSVRHAHTVTIDAAHGAAALEVMSRWAVDPRWLIYLPPTMSPPQTCVDGPYLEHPKQAFSYFEREGISELLCEEKHMGSRAVVVVCRDAKSARKRFGFVDDGSPASAETGVIYTRTGRAFFADSTQTEAVLERLRRALTAAGFWERFGSDWFCLDAELLPWSAKAQELLRAQYAPVGTAAVHAMRSSVALLQAAVDRGAGDATLLSRYQERLQASTQYVDAFQRYCWPVNSVDDLQLAPFHLLASEGKVHSDQSHVWHTEVLGELHMADPKFFRKTQAIAVNLANPKSVAEASAWWETATNAGGEGMVIKPLHWISRGKRGLVQPAIKCRGREYLRIIYGPEYTIGANLERLRQRNTNTKRALAMREYLLGLEGLERFVAREPLYRVHECVFGVLALESEPVDPRL